MPPGSLLTQRCQQPVAIIRPRYWKGQVMDRHAQGVLMIVLSAIAYSSAGFFPRLIHLDAWTMLFWRGLFAGLMILCIIVVQERGHTMAAIRAVGRPGFAAALCSTAATILYLN